MCRQNCTAAYAEKQNTTADDRIQAYRQTAHKIWKMGYLKHHFLQKNAVTKKGRGIKRTEFSGKTEAGF